MPGGRAPYAVILMARGGNASPVPYVQVLNTALLLFGRMSPM
jgi:hypothetical protein